ncbi:MAG TPA: energy transducer TonB, partial [Pyrinomonadaceae bacterium]
DGYFVRGTIRYAADDPARAAKDAETALRLNPEFAAAAYLQGEALLNLYIDESTRQAEKYPLTPASGEPDRKAVFEKRDAALRPFREVMQGVAARLEALAGARRDAEEAARMRELAGTLRLYGSAGGESTGVFRQAEVTTRAVITYKPEPAFTEEARQRGVTGRVRLRAVLGADGRVHNVVAIKRLPAGLTEKCVEVARKIRFTPAMRDGVPVSQYVVLEYNFNIY